MGLEADVEHAIRSATECFRESGLRFVLIGARVSEIMIDLKEPGEKGYGFRGTLDVDFAVQVNSWSEYQQVRELLSGRGFRVKLGAPEQTLFLGMFGWISSHTARVC